MSGTVAPTDSSDMVASEVDDLALPSRLSPSAAKDMLQCPRMFWFKRIVRLGDQSTIHTVRGNLAHTALEHLFETPRGEREPDSVLHLVREEWERLRELPENAHLLSGPDAIDEAELVDSAEMMVRNYFDMERPNNFDPVSVEEELSVTFTEGGVSVNMLGYIDRRDMFHDDDGEPVHVVSDYKTGKVPRQRYVDEAFFPMRVYAAAVEQIHGITPSYLRLIYLKTGDRSKGVLKDWLTPEKLAKTRRKFVAIWDSILKAHRNDRWPTRTGPLCDWCRFQSICPEFNSDAPRDVEAIRARFGVGSDTGQQTLAVTAVSVGDAGNVDDVSDVPAIIPIAAPIAAKSDPQLGEDPFDLGHAVPDRPVVSDPVATGQRAMSFGSVPVVPAVDDEAGSDDADDPFDLGTSVAS